MTTKLIKDPILYEKFVDWFRSRWPEFKHPLDSAYECYLRGRQDLRNEVELDKRVRGFDEL